VRAQVTPAMPTPMMAMCCVVMHQLYTERGRRAIWRKTFGSEIVSWVC